MEQPIWVSVRPANKGWEPSKWFATEDEAWNYALAVMAERGVDPRRGNRGRANNGVSWHEDGGVMAVWVKE